MKFVRIFFLLALAFLVFNGIAAASKGGKRQLAMVVKDTIIKLNPKNAKDRKLLRLPANDTTRKRRDTTRKDTSRSDSLRIDTTRRDTSNGPSEVTVSRADSRTVIDRQRQLLHIYDNARVTYGEFELDADYIRVDYKNKLIFASGKIDPKTKRYVGRPISKMGKEEKPVTSDSLLFNYETKKGKIYNGATEQDGNYFSGGEAKKINETEVAYRNVLFSTCNKPYPYTDFGIVITKGIAEKKRVIAGPCFMEIEGVPLPFVLPFGFFPKPDTRASGLMLPTFGEDARLGFFLRDFGYYFGINDYIDATAQATVFSKGSYETRVNARYTKLYKYQGSLTLAYGSHNYGLEGDPFQKDFNIQWSHSQNPNAHPGTTFTASVNAGTSSFYANNPATTGYNFQQLTQNNLSSSVAYGRTWAGTPFNLTATMSHRQDITRRTMTLALPNLTFNMATISPFDSKDRVGEQKWYQRITTGYTLNAVNQINDIQESELFKSTTLSKKLRTGFQHVIPVSFNATLLKYLQFNAGANYNEVWNLQTIRKRYARGSLNGLDSMIVDTVPGFRRAGDYSVSAGFSTKFYGTLSFKNSNLQAIRDVITANISLSYRPDYSSLSYPYNQIAVSNATVPYPATYQRYSIFEQSPYTGPGGGRAASLNFSIDNIVEAKVKAKSTDTTGLPRKIPILQGLSLSGFYNFAADSFKLSTLAISGRTSILNQRVSISFGGTLDPYSWRVADSVSNNQLIRYSRQINRYTWQDGHLPFLSSFNISMSASLNPDAFKGGNPNNTGAQPNTLANMTPQQSARLSAINSDPSAYVDFNVPWNLALSYSFTYNNSDRINTYVSNGLQISGDISLTPKWKIQSSTNFDLRTRKFADATAFSIYRDLHCWDLSISWVPFGFYKSYNVNLKVKASILQDLKISKRKDYYNNF